MPYGRLDYPAEQLAPFGRDKLTMEANNEIEAGMRLGACAKEPWTIALIESLQPGEVLWDVGANVGSYTLIAAARGVQVVAFEPVPENYGTLCRNLGINGLLDKVLALPFALADSNGLGWMHFSDMRSGAASHQLTASAKKLTHHQQLLPVVRADALVSLLEVPLPHAIKIDVDGLEPQVLIGMEEVLNADSLRSILVEMQPDWESEFLIWMTQHGWLIAERFAARGIAYGLFARAAAAREPAVKLGRAERRRQARDGARLH